MVDGSNKMFDLDKELSWIDNKYSEIVESANKNGDGYQTVIEDSISDDTNDTIENIERFIDDSYVAMLEQKNEEKDFEISFLIEELSNAYEVQDQVIMDSYALPLQFVENDKEEESKENDYSYLPVFTQCPSSAQVALVTRSTPPPTIKHPLSSFSFEIIRKWKSFAMFTRKSF